MSDDNVVDMPGLRRFELHSLLPIDAPEDVKQEYIDAAKTCVRRLEHALDHDQAAVAIAIRDMMIVELACQEILSKWVHPKDEARANG